MLHHQQRYAELAADVEDEPRHVLGLFEVHPRDRLVEQQQFGHHRQSPAQFDAFLDAVGQQRHRMLAPALDLEEVDDVLDFAAVLELFAFGSAHPQRSGQKRAAHADVAACQQVVEHCHLWEKLDVLEGSRHSQLRHPVGADSHDRVAAPQDVARLGAVDLRDRIEDGGLPGAVGADDGVELPGPDLERHRIDGCDPAEAQRDLVHFEQRRGLGPRIVHGGGFDGGFDGGGHNSGGHDSQRLRRL